MQISREVLGRHRRGASGDQGHGPFVQTYGKQVRIDNLEHGFLASTDFVADKKPDNCPGQGVGSNHQRV
jgi:hypothetical protein